MYRLFRRVMESRGVGFVERFTLVFLLVAGGILLGPMGRRALANPGLQGRIVNASTGLLVDDALVYFDDGGIVPATGGGFSVPDSAAGSELTIKAPGYRKSLALVAPGSPLDISLEPFEFKGIYVPFGLLALPERVKSVVDFVGQTELNSIVVDVKSDRGVIAYESEVPLASEIGAFRRGYVSPKELLQWCVDKDIYTVARIVVFKDDPLAHAKPELAVVDGEGQLWLDREQLGWANPFREEVWDYNIALAKEVAEMGFDEIQFDYIRFPSDGDVHAITYEEENTIETRTVAIRGFAERLSEELRPYAVFTSADVFGLTVWVKEGSDMGIGQRVEDISAHVDYLCPMVYPSAFESGNLGYVDPTLHPYGVVYRSTLEALKRSDALVRPWLQHYSLKGIHYDHSRLFAQRMAADEATALGAQGWTYWNAGGKYDVSLFAPEALN